MSAFVRVLPFLLAASNIAETTSTETPSIFNNNNYQPNQIIERDVCIIGGGATGTYAAVRLRDMGHSVLIVEKQDRLGGHTETFVSPYNGASEDLGVVVYQPLNLTRQFFGRFDLPLTTVSFGGTNVTTPQYDFRSGQYLPTSIQPSGPEIDTALRRYAKQLAKYPYLASGFDLEYPVAPDLLIPFGSFAEKHDLSAAVPTIFHYAQGLGDFLDQPTIYVMKNFGLADYNDISKATFVTSAEHDNSRLYERASQWLGQDQVSLRSTVVATARNVSSPGSSTTHRSRILISTPTGLQLILARKILLTIPPLLSNLDGWDLDAKEHPVFSQLTHSAFYTGLLNNTGLSAGSGVLQNAALNTSFNLPVFPGIYSLTPAPQIGKEAFSVKYGSPVPIPDEAVKLEIIAAVQRLQKNVTTAHPEFLAFKSHTPFEMTVSAKEIANEYYKKLYALQGRNGMFYTGATFHTHDSAFLWQFTEDMVLPKLNHSLNIGSGRQ